MVQHLAFTISIVLSEVDNSKMAIEFDDRFANRITRNNPAHGNYMVPSRSKPHQVYPTKRVVIAVGVPVAACLRRVAAKEPLYARIVVPVA